MCCVELGIGFILEMNSASTQNAKSRGFFMAGPLCRLLSAMGLGFGGLGVRLQDRHGAC